MCGQGSACAEALRRQLNNFRLLEIGAKTGATQQQNQAIAKRIDAFQFALGFSQTQLCPTDVVANQE